MAANVAGPRDKKFISIWGKNITLCKWEEVVHLSEILKEIPKDSTYVYKKQISASAIHWICLLNRCWCRPQCAQLPRWVLLQSMLILKSIIAGHKVLTQSIGHIVVVVFSGRLDRSWRRGEWGLLSQPSEERQSLDSSGSEMWVSALHFQRLTKQKQPVWIFVEGLCKGSSPPLV